MFKNVKVDAETHRLMSIRAAKLGVHKNTLASALIELGLSMPDEAILHAMFSVTSHVKTEYPSQENPPKSVPDPL